MLKTSLDLCGTLMYSGFMKEAMSVRIRIDTVSALATVVISDEVLFGNVTGVLTYTFLGSLFTGNSELSFGFNYYSILISEGNGSYMVAKSRSKSRRSSSYC